MLEACSGNGEERAGGIGSVQRHDPIGHIVPQARPRLFVLSTRPETTARHSIQSAPDPLLRVAHELSDLVGRLHQIE